MRNKDQLVLNEQCTAAISKESNVWRLSIAQALAGANSVVVYATGAIVGSMLAPSPILATLPISIFVVGMAACVFPAGELARCKGRRITFLAGTGAGVFTGILAFCSIIFGSFWLFCLSTFLGGAYAAVVLSFRFAATDGLPKDKRPQALSLVMAGGVLAGVIGPQLVTQTMNLWADKTFAATFLAQAAVAALAGMILFGVNSPSKTAKGEYKGRPLAAIALQPLFVVAVICGAVSYMVMNFLMTSAPLAMYMHGHSQESSNLGIQWHVVAMYAPSFFTGKLITFMGAIRTTILGILITALSIVIGLFGTDVYHFWALLILLGIGWNFGFLGASALVLECHSAEEKNRVQSLNDFIIFGLMALGSFSSGGIISVYGWDMVLWVSAIPLLLSLLAMRMIKARL